MARQLPQVISPRLLASSAHSVWPSIHAPLLHAGLAVTIIAIAIVATGSRPNPMTTATIIGFLLLTPLIWNRPALGVYILVGGAAVFETFRLGFPDSVTDRVPFFSSFASQFGGPQFLVVTAAEVVMGYTLVVVVLRRIAERARPLELGPLIWAVGFYMVMVGYGFVYGVGTGSDIQLSFWEARGQLYIFMAYLLAVNTIRDKTQVARLLWLFMIGVGLKGVLGTWRFLVTFGADRSELRELALAGNSLMAHEESFFFALFLALILLLFLFRSHRGQLWLGLLASAPVVVSILANQRRAGILIMLIAVVLVLILSHRLIQRRRRAIVAITLLMTLVLTVFVGLGWNSGGGLWSQPARTVRSLVLPSARDAGSNDFRRLEALNIKWNIQIDPLLGRGYGHPIIFYIPLPSISSGFYFWDITPHNTILWVWMRLGFVGFIAFWFLIGRSIVGTIIETKRVTDPYLKMMGAFTVIVLTAWIMMGLMDMGLVDFRETVLVGALIGVASRLRQIERSEEEPATVAEKSRPAIILRADVAG